jgi:hypothetical protein
MGLELAVLLVRGPHASRHTWFGYQRGSTNIEQEDQRSQKVIDLIKGSEEHVNDLPEANKHCLSSV